MSALENIIKFYTEFIMSDSFLSVVDKKGVLERRIKANTLFLTTDRDIIDIEKENYGEITHQTKRDFLQYSFYMRRHILDISIEELKRRFTDDFDGVIERMKFRIELYKDGWDVEQIESYIYRYMLKKEMPPINILITINFYHNCMLYLSVNRNDKKRGKGRPSLPTELKKSIKEKHLNKVRSNMRKGYIKQNLFDDINKNLLTHKEIQIIEKSIEGNADLIKKIRELYIREI